MSRSAQHPIGIDFGGNGIKAAVVDLATGDLVGDRERISTPEKSTPENVAAVMVELLQRFDDETCPVGVTVPAVVRHGARSTASTTPTPPAWPRRATASPSTAPAWSS
jgi:polyphosphate glucokinase